MSEYIHLCLSDLLDADLSSQEFFNTLPVKVQKQLYEEDNIFTFNELQARAKQLREEHNRYY